MKHWMRALLLLTPMLLSCASDDGVVVVNTPPEIRWTFNPIAVGRNWNVVLTVSVSDADADDALSVDWQISTGTLTPQNTAKTQMLWDVPNTLGVATATVTVSDGEDTDQVEAQIVIGTGRTSESLSSNLTLAGSPYILQPTNGTVTVPPVSNISVDPGVIVYFASPGGSIQVEGRMTASGNTLSPVELRANDRTLSCSTGPGWWAGIQARESGVVNLAHTEIWYADKGVHLVDSGTARLTACEIRCGNIGTQISSSGSLVVDSCSIDNNTDIGVYILSASSLQPDSVAIRNSNISINGITGIEIDICGTGCLAPSGFDIPITIRRNRIETNFTNGIAIDRESSPTIAYNHFDANGLSGGLSNLRLRPGYPGDQPPGGVSLAMPWLSASNNYWGGAFTDSTGIKATIRDREDDTSIGTFVYVTSWLNTSPLP